MESSCSRRTHWHPTSFVDVNGLWTIGVFSAVANFEAHAGFHIGFHFGKDPKTGKKSFGIILGPEGGWSALPNFSVSAQLMGTSAPGVRTLKGASVFLGGGGGPSWGVTGDCIAGLGYAGGSLVGSFSVGVPVDAHVGGSVDGGWVTEW